MSKFLDYTGLSYYHNKLLSEVSGASGKFYGFFTSASLLPSGTSSGYAYVGESEPFAIYNFNGSSWSDSGATVNVIKGEDGIGFGSISTPSTPDGSMIITLTNGDTITIDLNHEHPQYLKYEYLTSESQMPATPDETTLYLILDNSNA